MPYDYIEEYQKQDDSMIYKFLAGALKENNDILPEIEDKQPYLYRATNKPEDAIEYVQEKLIGASAAVNQLVQNGNFTTVPTVKGSNTTIAISNGEATLTPVDSSTLGNRCFQFSDKVPINTSHKMLLIYEYKYNVTATYSSYFALKSGVFSNFRIDTLTEHNTSWTKVIKFIDFGSNVTIDDISFGYTFDGVDSTSIRKVQIIDLTQMFGTAIADLAYSKEQASAGSGIAWLKSYGFFTKDYYPYNAGALQSVKTGSKKVVGKNYIDYAGLTRNSPNLTFEIERNIVKLNGKGTRPTLRYQGSYHNDAIFGKHDKDIQVTLSCNIISISSNINRLFIGFAIKKTDETMRYVSTGNVSLGKKTVMCLLNKGEYIQNIDINLNDVNPSDLTNLEMVISDIQLEYGSVATSYEEYSNVTYPLDSDLELRGLYTLDANNNIVCDGDEYTPDGSVKRRYGIVDLGTLPWNLQASGIFRSFISDRKWANGNFNLFTNKYVTYVGAHSTGGNIESLVAENGNMVYVNAGSNTFFIADSTYSSYTADQFKEVIKGTYIIYQEDDAYITTDSAASYQNPQIIHENGTEEFIDTRDYPLPVGHDTGYFTASDEKFFLPPVVDNNGRFLYHDGDGFQFKNFNQVASKVEESDINGNIKIDSVETQVYDDSELQGIVDTDTTTVTGNPLNFSTKSVQNAVNTDIVIDPVQDLHGFTKPWVGGAGKNLLPLVLADLKALNRSGTWSENVYTLNNVTFTVLIDSDNNVIGIKANGTANANNTTFLFLDNVENPFNGMIINGCPSGGTSSSYRIRFAKKDASNVNKGGVYDYGSGATITDNYPKCSVLIDIFNNYAIPTGGLTFYPMIRLSSVTDSTFAPYTNICPISPKEQISIQGCGKNLIDIDNSISFEKYSGGVRDGFEFFNLKPGTYTISSNSLSSGSMNVYFATKNAQGTWVEKNINATDKSLIFNILDGELQIWVPTSQTIKNIAPDLQLEYSNSLTDYEPYTPSNNLQIPLPNDFYGGTLNLETGELRVEKVIEEFDGSSDEEWTKWENNKYSFRGFTKNKHIQPSSNSEIVIGTVNNYLAIDSPSRVYASTADYSLSIDRHNTRFSVCINSDISTTALLREFLQNNVLQLCYSLATPYTIHLTPQQLNLLKATNNISTDAKTISVTYRNGELSTYAPATDIADGLLTATDKRAINRTSNIVEGNPIQFSTESKQIARSTIIDLEPIQDLHGYSKPWVGGAGKNLLPMTVDEIKSINTDGTWSGNEYTYRGVTYTLLIDSDNNIIGIKANGTPNEHSILNIKYMPELQDNTDYILNGCPTGGSETKYAMQYSNNVNMGYKDLGNGVTIQKFNYTQYPRSVVIIVIYKNYAANNLVFYPMIRLSTVSDATFEPYTNIASISGYDEVDINGCGENLSPINSFSRNGYVFGKNNYQMLLEAGTYIIKQTFRTTSGAVAFIMYNGYTKIYDQTFNASADIYTEITFAAAGTLTISEYSNSINNRFTDIMIIKIHQDLTIQLDDTVYGGKLDVEKGELVVTHNIFDIGDINWTYDSTYTRFASQSFSNIKHSTVARIIPIYSTCYESIDDGRSVGEVPNGGIYVGAGSTVEASIYINDYRYTSASDFTTGLAGQKVCYELASPFTIKLTPHQINLLKGVNTITTNANSIILQYRNGEVATLEDLKILSDNLIAHTEDTEPYGFIEHMSILDPAQRIEYIGKNKNYSPMTINLTGDHLANYNKWYDFPVIKENKPYMIKADGTVDYALDPNDYTKKFDGSASDVANTSYTGGAFAWIPKTYKREFTVGDDRYVYISTKKLSDEYEAIGFIDENGLEHDGAWIPMFYGTEITQDGIVKIMTLATGAPTQNRNTDTQKTYLTNANPDTLFFGGPIVKVLTDIMIMLGKNSDVQAVFGTGNMSGGNGAQYMKNNACIDGGAFYGTTTNNVLNKAFHSLVLLTQNQYQRDPYTLNIQGEYVVSPYYKYDLTGDSYVKTGVFVTPPSSNNWVYPHKSVSVPHWGAEPVGPYSGSTTTGWADGQYTLANQLTDTTVLVVLRFATCANDRAGGVRCVYLNGAASTTYWTIGASPLLLSKEKTSV